MTLKISVGLFTGQIPDGSAARTFHEEYRDVIELVRLVEAEGLDGAWVSEHHGAADGYLPSLLPMLGAFAAVTERIDLGTGVVLAPFHNPIRLAEDFAVVDQLSGGRVIAGLSLGWRDEEFRSFNLHPRERVQRTLETTEIMRRAWSHDRFDFDGRHYRYEQVAVTPKPARPIPILFGGAVDDAVRRAGRVADGYISSRAPVARVREAFAMAAQERADAGKQGAPIVAVLRNAFVTEDPERDWPMVLRGIGHQLGVYAGWRAGTDVPGTPLRVLPPDEGTIRETTAYGTPEQVVADLAPLGEALAAYPESHLILRVHYPGMTAAPAARAVSLLARHVAPALRAAAQHA